MNASDSPNGEELKGLRGLGKDTLCTDPFDLPAVVSILSRIEDAIEAVKDDPLHQMLEKMATALRGIVLNETPDIPATMRAVGICGQEMEKFMFVEDAEESLEALTSSIERLESVIGGCEEEEAVGAEDLQLDDLAARLITLTVDDKVALREMCDQLEQAANYVVDDISQPLRVAAAFIEQAILASTDDQDKSLASAGDFLAEAIGVYEKNMEQDLPVTIAQVDELVSETPPEPPAEEVDAQDQAPKPKPKPKAKAKAEQGLPQGEVGGKVILPEDADMDILKEYIVESLDHIEASEAALLELESDPDNNELINTVFRAFHTIKGTSGFFGLVRNQGLAHLAENLLDRARNGELKLTGGYADLCLRSCDTLRAMVEDVERAEPGGVLEMPEGLDLLMKHLGDPEGNGFTEDAAAVEEMRVGDILVGQGAANRDDVEQVAMAPGDGRIGQKLVKAHAAKATDVAKAVRQQNAQKAAASKAAEATVRVGTDRLDSMINMVGELVIAQSMVSEDTLASSDIDQHSRLIRNVSHAGKIIRDLQDLTMGLRMVPLKGVFLKMQRLVRDLAKKSNKNVQFVTEGDDTEIDRGMVELLNDPLLHMIRNSVDHGLEASEKRVASGKSAQGTVCLRAYHSAGNVVIELQDDGAGLNRDKIFAKAVERGLVSKDAELADQDVYNLIWQPGFSTADQITDVSGRGVGMDVVRRSIEELRGRVELTSEPGQGTTFTIRLPLTMAITDAMLLRVGQQRFLLPTISIEQSFRPEQAELSTVVGKGEVVMLRGELLPIYRVHEMFNVPEAAEEISDGILIVIEGDGRRCALLVDELLGQQQVVIKSLGESFGTIMGVAGASILGDGTVGLILDAGGVIKLASGEDEEFRAAG